MVTMFGLAILFVIVGGIGYFIGIYNDLVRLHHNIDKSWANIDVLLKQRRDELPKLVETCKAYMKYEQNLLEQITQCRANYMKATSVNDKTQTENEISKLLKNVFAVAENYPDLKANQNFLQLQGRISGLENAIADRREFFNESVNVYNIKIQQFPQVLVANMVGYQARHLLQIPEAETKDVELGFTR